MFIYGSEISSITREPVIPDNMPPLEEAEKKYPAVYTGEKMRKKSPEKYGKVVEMLVAGCTLTKIMTECKVTHHTIAAIKAREKECIEAGQEMTKGLTSLAVQMTLDKILEKLEEDKIPAGQLAILFGILRDKEIRDHGQPTQTIEVRKRVSIEEVRAELEGMKKAVVVDGELVEDLNEDDKTEKTAQGTG